jgi:hypothetical protein
MSSRYAITEESVSILGNDCVFGQVPSGSKDPEASIRDADELQTRGRKRSNSMHRLDIDDDVSYYLGG